MSNEDIFTDNDWPLSPLSLDESSINSSSSTHSTLRCNPYKQHNQALCPTLTNQQLYTATNHTTQYAIMHWITSNNQLTTSSTTTQQSCLPTTKLRTKRQPQKTIQPLLHQLLTNKHWGNMPTKSPVYFQVITKNVNSLSTANHNLQWQGTVQAMLDMDAHVLCIQEPNLQWTDGICQPIYCLFQ